MKLAGLAHRFKPDGVAAVILAAMIIAIWAPRAVGPLDFRWDGGVYYVLGTAIAEGKGYRLLNEPGDIEANQYPPLLPLIIAFHQWLVGSGDFVVVGRWMRLSYFLTFTAYIFAAYAVLRRHLSLPWALLAAVVVLLHVQMIFLSDLCFAELPFGLATTLFVLLAGRQTGPIRSMAAGTCAVVAYLLRTMGIALLAAWVLDALFDRRFRAAAIRAAVAVVPIFGWHAYIAHVERSPAYTRPAYAYQRAEYLFYNVSYARNASLRDPFKPEGGRASVLEVAHRSLVNLWHLPKSLGVAVSARDYHWERMKGLPIIGRVIPWRVVLYLPIVIGVVVLVGVATLFTRDTRLIGLYILLTAAGICLTPWPWQWQWPRYWSPVAPFLALALARGVMTAATWSERLPDPVRRLSHAGRIALVVTILAVQAVTMIRIYAEYRFPVAFRDRGGHVVPQHLFFYDRSYQALDAGLDWLGSRALPDDVVAASMPQWVYLRTGLKSVMPPFEADPVRAQELLDSVPVRFVVVDGTGVTITRDYALPLLERSPARWMLAYSNPSGKLEIYERRPEPTRSRP
ncbi:MAG TPA: hypothetical protein VNC82_13485 [Candidatus Limnocylindria bacterium]|nr:hypothetical protein [Candidatus Limnocylindria bacterium]